MAGTTVKGPGARVTIGAELQRALDQIEDAAVRAVSKAVVREAEAVAVGAEAAWYDHVARRTGRSGRFASGLRVRGDTISGVVETLDNRTAGKTGKPVVYYVKRPGPLSTVERKLTRDEYAALMKDYRASGKLPEGFEAAIDANGRPNAVKKRAPNPKASDGKPLLPELVTKPGRAAAKRLARTLGAEIAALAKGG